MSTTPGGDQFPPSDGGQGWSAPPPQQPPPGGYGGPPPGGYGGPPPGGYGGPPPGGYQQPIQNNLVWAILSTLFCCLPLGIVSIVFASQVSGKQAAGDYAGALDSAKKARTWAIASAAVALAGIVLYFVVVVLILGAGFLTTDFTTS